jgi:hypothetical protein
VYAHENSFARVVRPYDRVGLTHQFIATPRAQRFQEAYDLAMMKLHIDPGTKRRGNPNWFKPAPPARALLTEFEAEVGRLGLTKDGYVASAALWRWCDHNRNRVYVPEWLLARWGMSVETNSGAA